MQKKIAEFHSILRFFYLLPFGHVVVGSDSTKCNRFRDWRRLVRPPLPKNSYEFSGAPISSRLSA